MASDPKRGAFKGWFSYETTIALTVVACALPGMLSTVVLLLYYAAPWEAWFSVVVLVFMPFPFLIWNLQEWLSNPLRVASNIVASLREGDFTLRSRRPYESSGAIVELYEEINALATVMEKARMSGIETRLAIDKITANIDVATLIVDGRRQVAQANEAARRLIASITNWEATPIGRTVDDLQIAFCLDTSRSDFSRFSFVDHNRRFEGRRGIFRMEGERFELIVLTDITKAANEQERQSWKRLLRVLGHELNNSMAPISSLSSTLSKLVRKTEIEQSAKADMLEGLDAITSRSASIIRFMRDYTRLAKLPEPETEPCDLGRILLKAVQLFEAVITLDLPRAPIVVSADCNQLEHALINLLKNACEASDQSAGSVHCRAWTDEEYAYVEIRDNGPGIANPDNLFVPFYTTKDQGSGIGLALSKQILEAVGGSVSLTNRSDASGCTASVQLELMTDTPPATDPD